MRKKVYFVSSIIPDAVINEKFIGAIQKFIKERDGRFLLLKCRGIHISDVFDVDTYTTYEPYMISSFKFNSNLSAINFNIMPQQVNPLTGLDRFGIKGKSIIIASPKQALHVVPSKMGEIPHIIFSTGTVCSPKYKNNRIGKIAEQDNVLGGIIVEVQNNKIFHVRQVQWINDCFYDLSRKYTNKTISTASPAGLIMGDLHLGEEDQVAINATHEIIDLTKVKKVIMHDLISNRSISHHETTNVISRYQRKPHQKTLGAELEYAGHTLVNFVRRHRNLKCIVVKSNHDYHLERYLHEGRFVSDRFDCQIGAELFIQLSKENNPIEYWLKKQYSELNNMLFLKQDESYIICGNECGNHGDVGNSGARGSIKSIEISYGKSVIAHSHSPEIIRGIFRVGTNSLLRLSYNKGGSSWIQTDCLIYQNGGRTLINKINGDWKI